MRVNFQTNLYNSNILRKTSKPAFRGNDEKGEIKFMPIEYNNHKSDTKREKNYNKAYDSGYDNGYDHGYEDGFQDAEHGHKMAHSASLIGLALLGLVNFYNTANIKLALAESQIELSEQITSNDIELNERLDNIEFNSAKRDEIIYEALIGISFELYNLKEQRNALKEQIESLPDDDPEAVELKEELEKLENEYTILEEKYWDYVSQYFSAGDEVQDEESLENNQDKDFEDIINDPEFSVVI